MSALAFVAFVAAIKLALGGMHFWAIWTGLGVGSCVAFFSYAAEEFAVAHSLVCGYFSISNSADQRPNTKEPSWQSQSHNHS